LTAGMPRPVSRATSVHACFAVRAPAMMRSNFALGVQACYRGPRLYDSDETKALVKKWVSFYKKHRAILDSDIIHVRRADGRGIDWMTHVNPLIEERALAMIYNPVNRKVNTTLKIPLYYAGLTDKAIIREKDGESREYELDRAYDVIVPVRLGPREITWFVVEDSP